MSQAELPALVIPAPPLASVAVTGGEARFPVRRIYCVGRNYIEHIREMKEGDERDPPFFFQKPADAVVESGALVPYPADSEDFQFEVEMVVALHSGGRNMPREAALDHVYGYGVGIDLTRRDRQREMRALMLSWERGKAFDHSAPCGALSPVSAVGHLGDARLSLSVNGVEQQSTHLGQMIWTVPEIIAQLSQSYLLAPGDLIMTGTPAGVGPVVEGDVIEAFLDGVEPLKITIGSKE